MKNKFKEKQFIYDIGFIYELGSSIGSYKVVRNAVLNGKTGTPEKRAQIDKLFDCGKIDKNIVINSLRMKHNNAFLSDFSSEEYNDLCHRAFFIGSLQAETRVNNFLKSIKGGVKDIFYMQGNFINPIGLDSLQPSELEFYTQTIKTFLNIEISEDEYHSYMSKGSFLRADSIIAVLDKRRNLHILITDNSIDIPFLLKNSDGTTNTAIEALAFLSNDKKKKTQFSDVNTDTSSLDFEFSTSLMEYASISKDKNILKIIQSGSYAKSFITFIEEKGLFGEFRNIYTSLVGDTDTDFSIINLDHRNKQSDEALINMRDSYKEYKRDWECSKKISTIKKGFKKLSRSFSKNNKANRDEFKKLFDLKEGEQVSAIISEHLDDYVCTSAGDPNMQQQHSEIMINDFLKNEDMVICFLAGCPGIGKTYAYKMGTEELEEQLTLYFSPRNAINEDFVQFFYKKGSIELKDDSFVIINSSSTDEKSKNGESIRVVNYSTNIKSNLPADTRLTFKERGRDRTFTEDASAFNHDEGLNNIYETNMKSDGVMKRTSEAIRDIIYKAPNLDKIISFFTIQSLKNSGSGTTISALEGILDGVVEKNTKMNNIKINPDKFDEFSKLCPKIFIMIDEITGSSEGAELYLDIKRIFIDEFYDILTPEQKSEITLKIIVADASLPNKKLMQQHLNSKSKIEQDKIYFASINEDIPTHVYTEKIDERTMVINANAYPAKELNVNHYIDIKSTKISNIKNPELERKAIKKSIDSMRGSTNNKIIENAISDIRDKKCPQTILFVQDKKRIEELIDTLKKRWNELDNSQLVENRDFMVLNADLTEKQRIESIKLVEDDADYKLSNIIYPERNTETQTHLDYIKDKNIDLKFIFITSTASRGISFKTCMSMHILLQTFNIEPFLTELSQAIYRQRGDAKFDSSNEKYLNYYLSSNIVFQDDVHSLNAEDAELYSFDYKKNMTLLSTLSYLTILKGTMNTRIYGYDIVNGVKASIVPTGGKYVTSSTNSLLETVSGYRKLLGDAKISSKWWNNTYDKAVGELVIDEIDSLLIQIFKDIKTHAPNTVVKGGSRVSTVFSQYIKAWESKSILDLLNLDILHDFKIINGMIVFAINSSSDELSLITNLSQNREKLLKLLKKLISLDSVSSTLKQPTGRIINLLEFELGIKHNETIRLCELNNNKSRYVAIPIHVFTDYESVLRYDYSTQYSADRDDVTINALETMKSCIAQYTACNNTLPIISDFTGAYPYITFKSDNLENLYSNRFNKDFVLSSTSTNVFNLITLNEQ